MRPFLPIAAAVVLTASLAVAEDKPELTIYTYESFTAEWGPGPAIAKKFEESCGCVVKFVGAGDGAGLLSRLKLEGERSPADIVLGLDTNLTAEATATGLFAPHGIEAPALDVPVDWTDPIFLPYDWGYFAFVYDETKLPNPPKSFTDLIASDTSVVILDPRSSTPGLGLLLWIKNAYGDRAPEIWKGLAPRIVTVAPGWSEGYGLFLSGEVDMALAYTTSPAYHQIAEQDATKRAAIFEEGNYTQIEVAAMTAHSDQPELAKQFLAFMLSDDFQSVIPTTNWMYPAHTPAAGLPPEFAALPRPEKTLLFSPEEARELRDPALAEWLAALSK
ncbi:MAG: thiamine ABC transporter substrate binding subunit [Amaricoccus sp.]|uniref:thiamine ABC transporter substrate binding subunit n=1 Tax=Amaricoccus sp. TaxID=1872485 RepID=UPI0033156A77